MVMKTKILFTGRKETVPFQKVIKKRMKPTSRFSSKLQPISSHTVANASNTAAISASYGGEQLKYSRENPVCTTDSTSGWRLTTVITNTTGTLTMKLIRVIAVFTRQQRMSDVV